MTARSFTLAAFATLALAACQKPAESPAVTDSTAPANALPTVAPADSALKADSIAPKADSATPSADTAAPVTGGDPAK